MVICYSCLGTLRESVDGRTSDQVYPQEAASVRGGPQRQGSCARPPALEEGESEQSSGGVSIPGGRTEEGVSEKDW